MAIYSYVDSNRPSLSDSEATPLPGICAVVAASDFNSSHFMGLNKRNAFDCIVAVDGGHRHLQQCRIFPDIVIGDFDSLGYVPGAFEVLQYPTRKNKSDLELAFDWAVAQGYRKFIVYGALGRRTDHTLSALQIFAKLAEGGFADAPCNVQVVDESSVLKVLCGPNRFHLPGMESGIVSVIAAGGQASGVSETGLMFPLWKHTLSSRTSLGLSNELVGKPASIVLDEGTLYVFYPLPSDEFLLNEAHQ